MNDRPTWTRVPELRFRDHDNALREIAAALHDGSADEQLLKVLAKAIDPDGPGVFGVKLKVHRGKGAGAPPSKPHVELQQFLVLQIDIFEEKTEAVFAEAKQRFGASRSACARALQDARAVSKRLGNSIEDERATCLQLRDLGAPEYQPISWQSQ